MGWRDRLDRAVLSAPLAPVAATLAGGVAAESSLNWPGWAYPAAVGALVAMWAACRLAGAPVLVRIGLLVAVGFVLGGWRIGLTRHALPPDHVAFQLDPQGQIVTLRGQIQTRPILRRATLADFPGIPARDPDSSFIVRAESLRRGLEPFQPASGLVRVRAAGPALQVEPGRPFERTGWLHPVRPPANPGAADSRRAAHDTGIRAVLWLPSERDETEPAEPVESLAAAADGPLSWRDRLRVRARGLLLGQADMLTEDDQTLLDGLVLGARGEAADAVSRPFVRTGTYHYLAISGLHLGILAGFCWIVLRLARVSPRRAALTVLLIVATYCLMAELRPPILRAGIMIGLMCVGAMIGREHHAGNSLAAAVIVLLLLDPGELFGAGFQLSVVVVLGLVLFAEPMHRRLRGWLIGGPVADSEPAALWAEAHPFRERAAGLGIQLFSISTVAWVAGLPLVAYHFGRFYPWSILSSLVLWPLVWLALMLSFLKMLVAAALPLAGGWLNGPLHSASTLLLGAVGALDRLPGMAISVGRPSAAAIALFYGYLALWKVRPAWLRPRLLLAGGAMAAVALATAPGPSRQDDFELTVLAVGDGMCQVARGPAGQTVLFDCGSLSEPDVAERIVAPFLARSGRWVEPLGFQAAFLSHANLDHYSGFPGLARRGLFNELIVSPGPALSPDSQATVGRMAELVRRGGVRIRQESAGACFEFGDVRGQLLWPPAWADQFPASLVNDASQAVRLTFAGRSILLTGDVGEFAQQRLLDGHAAGQFDLRADVLVMPHHGAVVTNTDAFIRAVDPGWVIVSTGRRDAGPWRRAASLSEAGRRVLVTNRDGAVTVRVGRDGRLTVTPFITPDR